MATITPPWRRLVLREVGRKLIENPMPATEMDREGELLLLKLGSVTPEHAHFPSKTSSALPS